MPSVELLTECVGDGPLLHARCSTTCASHMTVAWDVSLSPAENLTAFLALAKTNGWVIGLLGNMCAVHHARAREAEPRLQPGNERIN